jgi:uncharacterized membrane protein YqgA involved in biofilm formation
MITGTILNTLTILVGALIGTFFRWLTNRFSDIFPKNGEVLETRLETIIMQGVSLCVLLIGISGSLKGENTLITILSIVIGALIGELLDLDHRIHVLGDWLQSKTDRFLKPESTDVSISEGFVTATLLFCVGSMTVTGSIQAGLTGDNSVLITKATLDLVSSAMLASSLGIGVLLAAVPVFVIQGGLVLLAGLIAPIMSTGAINEMTCAGSLLIIMIGTNLMGLSKIKVADFLPAILFAPVLYQIVQGFKGMM